MALTPLGKVLVVGSLLVAIVALLWPQIEELIAPAAREDATPAKGCPMGYSAMSGDMKLPDHHPPVLMRTHSSQSQTLFLNGNIWTGMQQEDGGTQWASALLVDGSGAVKAVDNRTDSAGVGAGTQVVDLQGRFVMPGFVDAHLHLVGGSLSLRRCELHGVASKGEFLSRVQETAAKLPPGAWLLGFGWDEVKMGGSMPDAAWLDAVLGERPALLHRMDGHAAVASSAALNLAAITAETEEPLGGRIDRHPDGSPTGVLREGAIRLVQNLVPEVSAEERKEAVREASKQLLALGITSVGDLGRFEGKDEQVWDDLMSVYFPEADAGNLSLRVSAYMPLATGLQLAEFVESRGGSREHPSKRLVWGGLKGFADGSLGSETALMWEGYHSNPDNTGTRVLQPYLLSKYITQGCDAGLQVAVHAIGDRAVDEVLELQDTAGCNTPMAYSPPVPATGRPAPFRLARIEHAQHLRNASVAQRLADIGGFVVANPQHLLADVAMLEERLGGERAGAGRAYPFGTMHEAKVRLAFGSDWPVVAPGPLEAVFAAAARRAPGSSPDTAWAPAEVMPVEAALQAHTSVAAAACGLDTVAGTLRPGLQADFVVLDASPFEMVARNRLPGVVATYVGGKQVFTQEGQEEQAASPS